MATCLTHFTSSYSVNLSIADTMVSSLNVTFNFVYMLIGHWPFGNVYCKICSFISILSVCGSVFTLIAISVDRYVRARFRLNVFNIHPYPRFKRL